jgi:hypothetical protein
VARRVGRLSPSGSVADLIPGFEPENALEATLAADPALIRGLGWGRPRAGHPEGRVGLHVADLLTRIDRSGASGRLRGDLRVVALVHDSLKGEERDWLPHLGRNHHAVRARRLAEGYMDDERVLAAIEHHDRPYHLWRRMRRLPFRHTPRFNDGAVDRLVGRLPDLELFARFVELDASTEGKDPRPSRWFGDELARRGALRERPA